MPTARDSDLRLLAVLAHPDDESLGLGGVLAHYAAEGVGTYVLTATRGQRGRHKGVPPGDGHPGPDAMARIREAELRAAVRALGIRELALLDYMDGELDRADPREAIARIATHVRRVRPQVVVTFDSFGGYGHPDHIAISQFTTAALVAAADPDAGLVDPALAPHAVAKLYYMASPLSTWEMYQAVFKRLVSHVDGVERAASPWPDWAVTTRIDTRAQWPAVWRAVSCHESQIGAYEKLRDLPPEQHEALWGSRYLYRAMSLVNGGRKVETDLFEGLRG